MNRRLVGAAVLVLVALSSGEARARTRIRGDGGLPVHGHTFSLGVAFGPLFTGETLWAMPFNLGYFYHRLNVRDARRGVGLDGRGWGIGVEAEGGPIFGGDGAIIMAALAVEWVPGWWARRPAGADPSRPGTRKIWISLGARAGPVFVPVPNEGLLTYIFPAPTLRLRIAFSSLEVYGGLGIRVGGHLATQPTPNLVGTVMFRASFSFSGWSLRRYR